MIKLHQALIKWDAKENTDWPVFTNIPWRKVKEYHLGYQKKWSYFVRAFNRRIYYTRVE